jgi:hypothetical protein
MRATFERTPEEEEDHPMANGHAMTPTSVSSGDMMDIDSKKVVSIADLCHPSLNDARGDPSGMDLLSQAAAALIDH